MFAAPWICRRCINSSLRPARRRGLRLASTTSNATFSPALLARAQRMAAEHDQLTASASDTFDIKLSKRIGELKRVAEAFADFEASQASLTELTTLLQDPSTETELRELAAEDLEATTTELGVIAGRLAHALTPKHPFEDMPCLIELRPGAGGSEAAIFAADLLRMYQALCVRKGFRSSLMKLESEDAVGETSLTDAILEVDAAGAYGALRSEAGVHRVQRVPATETKGRTHTSAVGVLVLPSLPVNPNDGAGIEDVDLNDPDSDYYVNPTDVRTDVMRARGAGGQHVNTTDSAVRLTHIPTNTVVAMQDSRSQQQNRAKAWMVLRSKLAQARREAREEEVSKLRRGVIGIAKLGRGDKVRTYNYGQQRVTDHRSGLSVHSLDDVMEGGDELEKVIDSVKVWLGEREMEGLMADDEAETGNVKKK